MSERSRRAAPGFARATLGVILAALYIPLVALAVGAFRSSDGNWTLEWVKAVLADAVLWEGLRNSLVVAITASSIATVLGTLAAVALARGDFPGRRWLQGLSLTSLVLPEIVFALGLLSWFFLLKITLGLVTVILAHVTFSLSYVLLTVGARLATLDPAIEDAARDLGAGEARVLTRVTLPLLAPSILAAFLLSFLLSFDDFLITFFVNGAGSDTLPVKLYGAMKIGLTPKLSALATMMWAATGLILILAFRSRAFRDVLKAQEGETS